MGKGFRKGKGPEKGQDKAAKPCCSQQLGGAQAAPAAQQAPAQAPKADAPEQKPAQQ